MPKKLDNIRPKAIAETRKVLEEQGYAMLAMRDIAKKCQVAVGTMYNYFPSKDMLVASFMLEDWMICIQAIEQGSAAAEDERAALYCMYEELLKYKEKYTNLFEDENAEASYMASSMQRHHLLCEQLAEPLKMWTAKQTKVDASFLAEFIAENMLTLSMAGKDFDRIASVLLQLF